jgi:hydroxymethylpyrimidine/phosphomethylpyrimidine kinase
MMPITNILTIAGSDSGGGAGIQADMKVFSALRTYGASVITALTAQHTQGVTAIYIPPPEFIRTQLDAVFSDMCIDTVKIGMLANAEVIHSVAGALRHWRLPYVVLDTVMLAKGGHTLLVNDAIHAMRENLFLLADLITPIYPNRQPYLICGWPRVKKWWCRKEKPY